MNERGMTLIEVLLVTVVATILVVAAGFRFNSWMEKYRVETQVKVLYSDLMDMRLNAMQTNTMHFIHLDNSDGNDMSYSIYRDDGDGNADTNFDFLVRDLSKIGLDYRIRFNGGGTKCDISVNSKGLMKVLRTIWIVDEEKKPYVSGGAKTVEQGNILVDYDCIVVSRTRINMGKLDKDPATGGTCVAK